MFQLICNHIAEKILSTSCDSTYSYYEHNLSTSFDSLPYLAHSSLNSFTASIFSLILNHFISDFTRISGLHRPVVFRWPEQLSAQGFFQAFFNQLSLPDHGRGSCWSAVAGRFTVSEAQYLVGMAFTAEKANGMGEVTVQHEGQWFDVLRIKELPE